MPTKALPRLAGHSFGISARVLIPQAGADGALLAYGSRLGGFALYLKDQRLTLANNVYGKVQTLTSSLAVPAGPARPAFDFEHDPAPARSGTARLYLNGQLAAEGRLERLGSPVLGAFSVGRAYTSPISPGYALPYAFSGTLEQLDLELR